PRLRPHLRALPRARRGLPMSGPSWHELWANLAIFKDAIWVGGLAGALLGAIGVHVVLRRMVFASSAIAQAAALGVALSFWIPAVVDPSGHAAGHAAGPAAHIAPSLLYEPVLWALAASLAAILFGSAVVVQAVDFHLIAVATVILLGGHAVLWRALLFAGYDPMGARVQGMPVRALNVFLFLSVGLSVALCTRALGALPVFAFSVLPAMTALALTAR